ncbi:MAG TPA: bifunctional demethylmenaquinone methyltransferase/2-methoxy-6-polyprenyl-1,4-benzoquinol methylase UbiE [Vicinamibacterales bacterium]|nr:bifunctional demethylmenaquinone methyltransferase/2-methoxy-6-polyprenyl-1,4-benzoquinol methylase UbiE [Vicinamibacterales bacterium]
MTAPAPTGPDKSPERIARMFDAIARRYDLLNHLLSLGLDRRWRKRAVRSLALSPGSRVLDLCAGTGDLALAVVADGDRGSHQRGGGHRVLAVDFAAGMLRVAGAKLARRGEQRIGLVRGDATSLPLPDASVDAAAIGFGIRNVQNPEIAAREIRRALKPGGRLAILEFGTPAVPGLRAAYLFYFRHVLPLIGRAISRHNDAYSYLPASVAAFPSPDAFLALLRDAGFSEVAVDRLTFGIVYLFVARKTGRS